jgi:hypothetical protein
MNSCNGLVLSDLQGGRALSRAQPRSQVDAFPCHLLPELPDFSKQTSPAYLGEFYSLVGNSDTP